jgi:hypothetical protein
VPLILDGGLDHKVAPIRAAGRPSACDGQSLLLDDLVEQRRVAQPPLTI